MPNTAPTNHTCQTCPTCGLVFRCDGIETTIHPAHGKPMTPERTKTRVCSRIRAIGSGLGDDSLLARQAACLLAKTFPETEIVETEDFLPI